MIPSELFWLNSPIVFNRPSVALEIQVKRLKRHKKEKHTSKNDLSMKGDGEKGTERVKGKNRGNKQESEEDWEWILILALSQRLRGNIFSSYDEKSQKERGGGARKKRNKGGAAH